MHSLDEHTHNRLLSFFASNYDGGGAEQGGPILQSIVEDCHYVFEWPTNVICPKHESQFREKSCAIYNDKMNATLDLRKVFKDGIINVSVTDSANQIVRLHIVSAT